jgi:hypothetical protein
VAATLLSLVAAAALAGQPAAGAAHRVALTVSIAGAGTVRLADGRYATCRTNCMRKFLVRRGASVRLTAHAGSGWVFSYWAGACSPSPGSACRLRLRRPRRARVVFLPPGSTRANPVRLGRPATVAGSWLVSVQSVSIDATAQIVAIPGNAPPRTGAQYAMLYLVATYVGGGFGSLGSGAAFYTVGARGAPYDRSEQELPSPQLGFSDIVYAGQTIGGNVAYEIASRDASSLVLFAGYYEPFDQSEHKVWFALR